MTTNKRIKTNPAIEKLTAYQLADLSVSQGQNIISLAQNESCFKPSRELVNVISSAACESNLYPDPSWSALTHAIADLHNINQQQILCGAGSMELLELLCRTYLTKADAVLMSEYSYSFMRTVTQMYGASLDIAKEIDFTVDVDLLLDSVKANTKIVFIANPGNPTGTLLNASEVRRLRADLPDNILLILDEAYAEFTDPDQYPALFDLVELQNVVVLRTFSKFYGLAAMRIGWGYFPKEIFRTLRKVINPNNISGASQAAATWSIRHYQQLLDRKKIITTVRDDFRSQLLALNLDIPQSMSNFVLIDFKSHDLAQALYEALKARGIIMRPMNAYELPHCLRATISIPQHMEITVNHMKDILKEHQ